MPERKRFFFNWSLPIDIISRANMRTIQLVNTIKIRRAIILVNLANTIVIMKRVVFLIHGASISAGYWSSPSSSWWLVAWWDNCGYGIMFYPMDIRHALANGQYVSTHSWNTTSYLQARIFTGLPQNLLFIVEISGEIVSQPCFAAAGRGQQGICHWGASRRHSHTRIQFHS